MKTEIKVKEPNKDLRQLINELRKGEGDTYQNGIKPGPKKLQQFREVMKLREVPTLGTQDKSDNPILFVKLFDPTGSWTWFLSEWNPRDQDSCFGLVHGFEKEWGYISLAELAVVPGAMGIGIEIDMHWIPRRASEVDE